MNRGGLCARGQAAIQVTYHPDRITQPLKRKGNRGDGNYEAITWDAAIAEMVVKLNEITGSANSLAFLGKPGSSHRHALSAEFLSRFGAFTQVGARAMLARRCEEAGIRPINWHRFRHRMAHVFLERGGQEGDLAKLGGWTDPGVMRRYGSALATERALDAYDDLGPLI